MALLPLLLKVGNAQGLASIFQDGSHTRCPIRGGAFECYDQHALQPAACVQIEPEKDVARIEMIVAQHMRGRGGENQRQLATMPSFHVAIGAPRLQRSLDEVFNILEPDGPLEWLIALAARIKDTSGRGRNSEVDAASLRLSLLAPARCATMRANASSQSR